ncbi:Endoribonuclease YbeY [BD1-7 clade bacterium]|uniref:Endoribonuclease YbeY n=1 Tax=BD1-7 clade bacterium TaxID=2029982 RepID=A0A5S9QW75_9GAMM|nr:Endoribonuclease YbeY [BD1-7 clade bacterium]
MSNEPTIKSMNDSTITLTLDIQRLDETLGEHDSVPDDSQFQHWTLKALTSAKYVQPDAEVSLTLVDTAEITRLNREYRHKNDPTNVLSFPADLPEGVDVPLLGDIIICPAVVMHEAGEQHKSIEAHWAHMTVHGILHLLGFDHIIEHDAHVMEALEIAIMKDLGYDNPYEQD